MMPFYLTFTRFPPLPSALTAVGGGGIFCCHHGHNWL
nr:MAG TPA: hypothetical protein [Caudoviricetes sp.]